ncbi:hypothetical protein GL263_14565 [Streptomyces durbertensis]|uniref:Uncharacterized protein n=1 Tax=Streptomyces durbertensis TaxID=2448886 RepID=A0ABR6EHH6_9ACTN|nr:hypothetical protein [Streptomyces durbertensis]MBB1244780.1 hypothetical protein [Streptomyces durbertensis]
MAGNKSLPGGSEYEYHNYIPPQQCFNEKHTTNFANLDVSTMKAMVGAANPTEVLNVAKGWEDLCILLVGSSKGGGTGGIHKDFTTAVKKVLNDWQGDAADRFKEEAEKIRKKLFDASEYARYTHLAMQNVGTVLKDIKAKVESMEEPGDLESAADKLADGKRDDSGLKRDLAAGMSTEQALQRNAGSLSLKKEWQLEVAVYMERLGSAYNSQAKAMGTWQKRKKDLDNEDGYPGSPGGIAPVPAVLPPGGAAVKPAGLRPGATGPNGPGFTPPSGIGSQRPDGITGGVGTNKPGTGINGPSGVNSPISQVGTGLNGVSPNSTGLGGGGAGLSGAGLGGGVGGAGTGAGASGTGAMPGGIGGAGAARGAGSRIGGAGGRVGGAGRMGGMPGMGGAGAGAGGVGKGGGSGRGALAKTRGGVVGAAGKPGAGAQGGSGLHRSRGGSQAGKGGTSRGAGMMGAPGARGAAGNEDKNRKDRPDYLVEDEETWTTKRNVAPRVIE